MPHLFDYQLILNKIRAGNAVTGVGGGQGDQAIHELAYSSPQ